MITIFKISNFVFIYLIFVPHSMKKRYKFNKLYIYIDFYARGTIYIPSGCVSMGK